MQRFKNILLVHDSRPEEKSGLWRATDLARRNGARLTVLDVIPELPLDTDTTVSGVRIQEAILEERRRHLDWLLAPIRDDGIDLTTVVRTGKPFVEIIHKVLRDEHDLVIKTARGSLGLKGRIFGSTALHLIRKCPCPVWVVKPGFRAPHGRILAAVDPSRDVESLDRKILQLATSLAVREESEPHVVHAWGVDDVLVRGRLPRHYVNQVVARTRDRHEKALSELMRAHDNRGISHHLHFQKGPAEQVIVSKAHDLHADLIIMGTIGRTGIAGLFIGDTAEAVLQQVNCSVLAVKPDGFVTPIISPVVLQEEPAREKVEI